MKELGSLTLEQLSHEMTPWCAALVAPELLSLGLTAFRLCYRWSRRGLWWDDCFALLSSILAAPIFATTLAVLIAPNWTPSLQLGSAWLLRSLLPSAMWTTRISLALAIGRIMPPHHPIFRVCVGLSIIFGMAGIAFPVSYIIVCRRNNTWTHQPPYFCFPSHVHGVIAMTTDMICDICLALAPVRLFWHAKLRPGARISVLTGFGASVLTLMVTFAAELLHVLPYGWTLPGKLVRPIVMHIATIITILVCNSLVGMTFIYRLTRHGDEDVFSELSDSSRASTVEESRNVGRHHGIQPTFTRTIGMMPLVLTEISSVSLADEGVARSQFVASKV
ncbi:hypothetical protein CPB83DRAFT_850739, partial [Crepidotus variabilis]